MSNLGYLFYKDYFLKETIGNDTVFFDPRKYDEKSVPDREKEQEKERKKKVRENNKKLFTEKNKGIVSLRNAPSDKLSLARFALKDFKDSITLTTTYPGLLLGSGYTHETGSEGEFKLGFFFDYTTGLPIIPGSSWKGVCRSLFPKFGYNDADKGEKVILICSFLKEITGDGFFDCDVNNPKQYEKYKDKKDEQGNVIEQANQQAAFVNRLEQNMFEGLDSEGKSQSMYRHDIFHDAYISTGGEGGRILYDDYITPHINRDKLQLSPFTNPVPIQFLKIGPGVTFIFQYRFQKFEYKNGNEAITIEQADKEELCRQLLIFKGIGAKTNVGYGQLQPAQSARTETPAREKQAYALPQDITFATTFNSGAKLRARVTSVRGNNEYSVDVLAGDTVLKTGTVKSKDFLLQPGDIIAVKAIFTNGIFQSLKLLP